MSQAIYRNIHAGLYGEAYHLLNDSKEVKSRAGNTKESLARTTTLLLPTERVHFYHAHRRASPAAMVAETLWLLAGRNDIAWLTHYLPRAPQFSDNGTTWRGAYGPRLRAWGAGGGGAGIDQVLEVRDELRRDPMSRRAVLSLWDPSEDNTDSKDIPCNNWLQFLIRDNKLHMFVTVRSNDIWWGWSGINAFAWSVLQEAMAFWLGVEVGEYTTFAGSWHLYERHWKRADALVNGDNPRVPPVYQWLTAEQRPHWSTPFEGLTKALERVWDLESVLRRTGTQDPSVFLDHPDPLLRSFLLVLASANDVLLGRGGTSMLALLRHHAGSDIALAQLHTLGTPPSIDRLYPSRGGRNG